MRALRSLAISLALAAFSLSGCGDDSKSTTGGAPAVPTAVAETKGGPLLDIVAPPHVIAFGGASNAEKLLLDAQNMLGQVLPIAPALNDILKGEARRKLALTKLDGIDWTHPSRVAFHDPKAMPAASVSFVLSVSNKDQLLASLPPTKKENDEGNAYSYRDDLGRTAYWNLVDDMLIATFDKGLFPKNKEFFIKLAKAEIPENNAFVIPVQNITTLYKQEIDDIFTQAKQQAGSVQGAGEAGMRVIDWMGATFKETEKIVLVPTIPEDGALLSIRIFPKAGTELAKSFSQLEARPHTLISRLPQDVTMFGSLSTNPDAQDGFVLKMMEWALSVGGQRGQMPESYFQTMRDYVRATGGEVAFAAHPTPGGQGMSLTSLLTVRDADKVRTSIRKSKEVYKEPQLAEMYKKLGISIDSKENAYKIGSLPVDVMQTKIERGKVPLAGTPMESALGELTVNHLVVDKDVAVTAYGSDAKKTLEAFFGNKLGTGLDKAPGVVRAMSHAVKSPFLLVYVAPIDSVRRVHLNGKNPLAAGLADLTTKTGIAISAAANQGALEIVIDVPAEQGRAIGQAVARTRGAGAALPLPE